MTDYFYQANRRPRLPEAAGEPGAADSGQRRSAYPPEDEAYWAESGGTTDGETEDGPLWYEDRVRPIMDEAAEPLARDPTAPPAAFRAGDRWYEPAGTDPEGEPADPEGRADETNAWA